MKNILTIVGMAVLGVMVVYLGFAFSQWNINPAKWSDSIRLLAGVFVMTYVAIVILVGMLHYSLITEDADEEKSK